jgi:RNA polymerase sigma factor for flagellar operon FliA
MSDIGYYGSSLLNLSGDGLDPELREALPKIIAYANNLYNSFPPHMKESNVIEREDLIMWGISGFLDAKQRYDPEFGKPLMTFAKKRIRGAMLDFLRDFDYASRSTRSFQKKQEAARTKLSHELGREPTKEEIAERVEMPLDRYYKMEKEVHDALTMPLEVTSIPLYGVRGEDDVVVEYNSPNHRSSPEFDCHATSVREAIDAASARVLDENEAYVLFRYHKDRLTMAAIEDIPD